MTHHHLRREKTILAAAEAAAARAAAGKAGKAVKGQAGAEGAILAAVEVARVRVAVVIQVVAAAVVVAVARALAVAAAVILAAVVAAAAAEGREVVIQEAAEEEEVRGPAAAHLGAVEVAATPEDPAAAVAVRVAEAARVLVGVRAAAAADKGAATAGVPVVEGIGSFKGSGGCRLPAGPFSPPGHRTALFHKACTTPPDARGGGLWCTLAGIPSHLEELVSTPRGRQARLRTEYASLYPGLKPGIWMPVEKLLSLVTDLIHKDRSKSGIITGRRLLHDEHFEYRGISTRPEGLPQSHSRLSDSSAEPSPANESSGPVGRAGLRKESR